MRFKNFAILEKDMAVDHHAVLIVHKIHDMIENSHVEVDEDTLSFDLGQTIKNSAFKGVKVIISTNDVVDKDPSDKTISIKTTDKISRSDIKTIISSKKVFDRLTHAIGQYIIYNHEFDKELEDDDLTTHERKSLLTDKTNIDENYTALIAAFKKEIEHIKKQIEELMKEKKNTGLGSKIEALNSAIDIIVGKEIGASFKEFQKNIMKLPEAGFIAYLEGTSKKIIMSRLHDFYEGYLTQEIEELKNKE
jgi:hypothetical protein